MRNKQLREEAWVAFLRPKNKNLKTDELDAGNSAGSGSVLAVGEERENRKGRPEKMVMVVVCTVWGEGQLQKTGLKL